MTNVWPTVRLGDVLHECDRAVPSSDLDKVNLAGVYSFGRGLFKRGPMSPGETSYTTYNRLFTDDFVISQPKAWEGALARVTPEFEGWFLSPVFPTFRSDAARLDVCFLEWFCKRESVWTELQGKSRGIGARRESVLPSQFLSMEIPLPPLAKQRLIVGRIEELAGEIATAQRLRAEVAEEAEALLVVLAHRGDLTDRDKELAGWRRLPLRSVVRHVDDSHRVDGARSYPNLGIYSYGRGLFPKPDIEGASTSAPFLRRVHRGQFIYSRLFAFEGAYGVVSDEFDERFVSNEYPTFDCDGDAVLPEFLGAYFKAPSVWRAVAVGSKGIGHRRQRVQLEQLLSHELWVPPMDLQRQLAVVVGEIAAFNASQGEVGSELDAFMPAVLDRAFKGEL
ncbi:MAG: hypothetical protein NTV49_01625 [Kiritimatiellaeota bacterium]|nr:hypothetical protein [Kiritimatiellota bacterium]